MVADAAELEPYRREVVAYCYRMLASPHEAEDAAQDTFLRAWRGLSSFENRAGLRPWLYRIATNVCFDMLKGRRRRAVPMDISAAATGQLSLGTPLPEATWVQPIPDGMVLEASDDPAEIVVLRESIRLALIAALQHLTPGQRAVLILRDVLSWKAGEVAELLDTSEDAVNSTLRRARAAAAVANLESAGVEPPEVERELLARYIAAFERYDVDALVALLREDATLAMPPFELWLRGKADIHRFMAGMAVEGGRDRLIPVEANGSPAVALYRPTGPAGAPEPHGIHVLEVTGGRIATIHAFLDTGLFPIFGLPAEPQPND